MPNDAYQRRLAEWEKKERERKAAMGESTPYDPINMESRVPLGCTMLIISGIIFLCWLVWRYFRGS